MKTPLPSQISAIPQFRSILPSLTKCRTGCALVLLSLAGIVPASAQSQNLIENGDFKDGISGWHVYSHLASKKPDAVVVAGPDAETQALQVTVPDAPDLKKYQIGFSQPINRDIAVGDAITLRFMARSPQNLTIGTMVHTIKEPHQNKFYKDFNLTPEWETYEITGKKPVAFATGEAGVEFFLSFGPGQVEITKVEVLGAE